MVKNLDLAICYSEFGRTVLKEFMPFTSIDMIHLGVDTSIYRPLENREELRKKFKLDGKFVIGCIARNQTRKRLDKLIEGFAKFSAKKPNACNGLSQKGRETILCPFAFNYDRYYSA